MQISPWPNFKIFPSPKKIPWFIVIFNFVIISNTKELQQKNIPYPDSVVCILPTLLYHMLHTQTHTHTLFSLNHLRVDWRHNFFPLNISDKNLQYLFWGSYLDRNRETFFVSMWNSSLKLIAIFLYFWSNISDLKTTILSP